MCLVLMAVVFGKVWHIIKAVSNGPVTALLHFMMLLIAGSIERRTNYHLISLRKNLSLRLMK